MSTNNYFKVGNGPTFFFDDRSAASTARALEEAKRLQGLRTTLGATGTTKLVPRISVFRRLTLLPIVPGYDSVIDPEVEEGSEESPESAPATEVSA